MNLNTYFDKIYYINLDKDKERNFSVLEQFKRWNITNFKRFPAVEIKEKPDNYLYRNFIRKHDRKYLLGALGCRQSHIEVIKEAKSLGYKKILILEDDVLITTDPHMTLNQSTHNEKWHMLYFGGHIENNNGIKLTHAYGISSLLFDEVTYMAPSSGMEIDDFYSKVIHKMYYYPDKYIIEKVIPFDTFKQLGSFESNIQFEGYRSY